MSTSTPELVVNSLMQTVVSGAIAQGLGTDQLNKSTTYLFGPRYFDDESGEPPQIRFCVDKVKYGQANGNKPGNRIGGLGTNPLTIVRCDTQCKIWGTDLNEALTFFSLVTQAIKQTILKDPSGVQYALASINGEIDADVTPNSKSDNTQDVNGFKMQFPFEIQYYQNTSTPYVKATLLSASVNVATAVRTYEEIPQSSVLPSDEMILGSAELAFVPEPDFFVSKVAELVEPTKLIVSSSADESIVNKVENLKLPTAWAKASLAKKS